MFRCMLSLSFLLILFLAAPATAQNGGDKPLAKFMDPMGDLAKLKVVDGRLRLDLSQWVEAVYPASKGDQIEQMLADLDDDDADFFRQLRKTERQQMMLSHSADILFERIRVGSGARSHGGGKGIDDARRHFRSNQFSAGLFASLGVVDHFSFAQHDSLRRHLSIDDLPDNGFRLEYGSTNRLAVLTQNESGQIQFVKHDRAGAQAMVWPHYQAMVTDDSQLKKEINSELSLLLVELPTPEDDQPDPKSISEVTGKGPLNELAEEIADLIPIRLIAGRLVLDSKHWDEIVGDGPEVVAENNRPGDPFGNDPFGFRARRAARMSKEPPLARLIFRFGPVMKSNSSSGGGSNYTRTNVLRSPELSARFFSDRSRQGVKMTFLETSPHGRCISVEHSPLERFALTYSAPNRLIMIVQQADGQLCAASCDGAAHSSDNWSSYQEMIQSDDPSIKLWTDVVAPLGPKLPPANEPE